ncbi:hypothetical protein ACTJNK_29820 [Achromobacter anxifer]
MAQLSEYEKKVLAALEGTGAMLTRDVAAKVRPMFGTSVYMHTSAVRAWLLHLEKNGYVCRLDNEKPVCWQLAASQQQED